jgi:hypothetical protein
MTTINDEQNICDICAEKHTKRGGGIKITCQKCYRGACRKCCETYVLDESSVRCMYPDCGEEWSSLFISSSFSNGFITGALKRHRESIYVEREKALLPATQGRVIEIIREEKNKELVREFRVAKKEVVRQYVREYFVEKEKMCTYHDWIVKDPSGVVSNDLGKFWVAPTASKVVLGEFSVDRKAHTMRDVFGDKCKSIIEKVDRCCDKSPSSIGRRVKLMLSNHDVPVPDYVILGALLVRKGAQWIPPGGYAWKETMKPVIKKLKKVRDQKCSVLLQTYISSNTRATPARVREKTVHRFVRACPCDGCKGYLSTAWKCGLCSTNACSKCHVALTDVDDIHECDPDVLATAQLIAKESKPCPGCHINITKIDGCNQMWCTQCKTPWDWKSGRIETKVHNPHYFEYLRTRGAEAVVADRNPAEIRCGRDINHEFVISLTFIFNRLVVPPSDPTYVNVFSMLREFAHFSNFDIRYDIGDSPNAENLRVCFMREMITEVEFKRRVQMLYKKFYKETEIRDVSVMFKQTMTDIMYRYRDELDRAETTEDIANANEILNEVEGLKNYANACLKDIASAFQSRPIVIRIRGVSRI